MAKRGKILGILAVFILIILSFNLVSANQKIRFNLDEEYHYLDIIKITNDSATIEITPGIVGFTLKVGEQEEIDINGDGLSDLDVKLNSVTNQQTYLTFKNINNHLVMNSPELEGSNSVISIILIVGMIAVLCAGVIFSKKKR